MPYNILLFHVYYSMNPRVLITRILLSHTTFCSNMPLCTYFPSIHPVCQRPHDCQLRPRLIDKLCVLTTLLPAAPSLLKSYYYCFRKEILGEPAPCSSKNRITMSQPQQMARGQCVRTPIVIDQTPLFKTYRTPHAQLQLQCIY